MRRATVGPDSKIAVGGVAVNDELLCLATV